MDDWYGDVGDRVALEHLSVLHQGRGDYYTRTFSITPAPGGSEPEAFRFCTGMLRTHLVPAAKRLSLGEHSRLPTHLTEVPPSAIATSCAKDHSAVAALAFAVARLTLWGPPELKLPDTYVTEYDIFGEGKQEESPWT